MARQDDGTLGKAAGQDPTADDAFFAELSAYAPDDAARMQEVHKNVSEANVDSDPTWFVRYLTQKQIAYGIAFVKHGGNFRKAANEAGYGKNAQQDQVEEGPAMRAYMVAVKKMVADRAFMTGDLIVSRLNRLAMKAEERGQIDPAIRANVKIGEALGIFVKNAPTINVNGEGAVININAVRSDEQEEEDEAMDAVFREIAEENGIPALPARGGA